MIRKASFEYFMNHHWVGNGIHIRVQWTSGDCTWESEAELFKDAPQVVLAYWKNQGGRPANPEDPDLYNITAIWDHRSDGQSMG